MAKSQAKSTAAKKPQAARAKAPAPVKASALPKIATPSEEALGFAFKGEIEHVATPVPPLSSKAKARAKRAARAEKTANGQKAASEPAHTPQSKGLFADAEAEAKAAKHKRQGASATTAPASDSTESYVDEAKRAFKTAKVSLTDVVDSIPWDDWRQRVGAGLGSTLVQAGKWLTERGSELARQAEAASSAASKAKSRAAKPAKASGADGGSAFADQHPNAHENEQQA